MILNRIDPGTACTVRETGKTGTVKKIYFYPTKFEIEFPDGHVEHYSSKDIEFDGINQESATLQLPPVPDDGIGECWTDWKPFKGESIVKHHFSTTKNLMWKMLTSLEMYNVWFYGIQRAMPHIDTDRYVHRYNFSQLDLKPGAYFKIRPMTIAPWFKCRIMTMEKEKEFGFTFRTTPLTNEYVQFSIHETDVGVWVTCRRTSQGFFSILNQINWQEKSKILQRLDTIVPKIDLKTEDDNADGDTGVPTQFGGFTSRQDYIDYAINMGMQGNMDFVNGIPEKPIRGMAKAGILKAERTGETPLCPEKPRGGSVPSSGGGVAALSTDELVAYLVNKGLDGDMDTVNGHENKAVRGKAKAMIVKVKRGAVERPPIPEIPTEGDTQPSGGGFDSLSNDEQITYLVNKGLDGDMDLVNSHDDKITRGKAKAMIVKVKRGALERPPLPEIPDASAGSASAPESEEQMMERLIAKGLEGNMDEINALDNRVLRGKIKSAIVKAKRAAK